MEKIVTCSYNKTADELNISLGNPKNAISLEIGPEIYAKLDPKTKNILGFTILHFEERSMKRENIFSLPLIARFKLSSRLKENARHLVSA